MTEDQMWQRIKEIDKEKNKLNKERKEYEDYFFQKELKDKLAIHQEYVGKYYDASGLSETIKYRYIKAFKILEVLNPPNECWVQCTVLIDGIRRTCWKEYGILNMAIPLWAPARDRLAYSDSDPKVIDFCKEISEEEFSKLSWEYSEKLRNITFGEKQ